MQVSLSAIWGDLVSFCWVLGEDFVLLDQVLDEVLEFFLDVAVDELLVLDRWGEESFQVLIVLPVFLIVIGAGIEVLFVCIRAQKW